MTPRTALVLWATLIGLLAGLWLIWTAREVLTWIFVALFLAVAIAPAVSWLQRHGVRRRGAAAALVYLAILLAIVGVLAALLPPLISQVNSFIDAVPGYVHELTKGRGPLGFLETKYHVVERTREAIQGGGTSSLAGGAGALLSATQSLVKGVAATVTIVFLTFFLLLEGPTWMERIFALMRPETQRRWRGIAGESQRVVGGYVSGNLLISLIAATSSTVVLLILGVPFPLALGLVVFILDLIPLAGATIAAIILTLVALTQSVTDAVVVAVFFIVYQQLENHLLQPVVYGRTVSLSPLLALVSVLIGAALGGVLGALAAIPVAGCLQILVSDWYSQRAPAPAPALSPD
jgi:predicted PurR-regulated permease PerM